MRVRSDGDIKARKRASDGDIKARKRASDGDIKARKRASVGDIKARKCAARRQEEQKRRRDRRSVMLLVLASIGIACTKMRLETISVDRALACPSLRFADDDWNNRPPAPHQSTLGKDSIIKLHKNFCR